MLSEGAGIGNFLIFYPAAYFFAAMTGRDILIIDDSLISEMCSILTCGYPKFNEVKAAFPAILGIIIIIIAYTILLLLFMIRWRSF